MTDVIIAVIPAPGHEGLVAEGPRVPGCTPERPMLVWQCGCGRWGHSGCASLTWTRPQALVLFAPGGPRLGMVRAEGAVNGFVTAIVEPGPQLFCMFVRRDVSVNHPENATSFVLPDPPELPERAFDAFALAHLLHQHGLASEVLVLPVPA